MNEKTVPAWRRLIEEYVYLPDGRQFVKHANNFQWEDFAGLFKHRFGIIIRPRGNSKTFDIAIKATCDLVISETQQRVFCLAVDEDQAEILHNDVAKILTDHPHLKGLAKITTGEIKLKHSPHSFLTVLPHHAASALGLRPSRVFLDELAAWPERGDQLFFAMYNALIKTKESKLAIISSPGWNQGGLCYRILQEARKDPERWYCSERGPEADWITEKDREMFRASGFMPEAVYRRDYEGVWTTGHGAYFEANTIEQVFVDEIPADYGAHVMALDMGISKDRAAIVVVKRHAESQLTTVEGISLFDPKQYGGRIRLKDVEDECFALARMFNAPLYYDKYEAVGLAQRLINDYHIPCHEYPFTQESRKALFSTLADLINTGKLKCPSSNPYAQELRKELLGLEVIPLASGGWRVNHRYQFDDITVALGIAIMGLPAVNIRVDSQPWVGGKRDMVAMHNPHQAPRRDPKPGAYGEKDDDAYRPWGSGGSSVDWNRAW